MAILSTTAEGFVYVDVETRTYVTVYGSPELDGEIGLEEFEGEDAYEDACAFAEAMARRLGCTWGCNKP